MLMECNVGEQRQHASAAAASAVCVCVSVEVPITCQGLWLLIGLQLIS